MLGSGGVGKTAITLQFVKGEFSESYVPTIEDEFQKEIEIDGESHVVEIIDTAGQEDFKDLRARYIKDCDGFIFVYAVDDESSLNFIQELYDSCLQIKNRVPPAIIVGNKCDLPQPHAVTKEAASAKSKSKWNDIPVVESSAKINQGITEAFEMIVRKCTQKNDKPQKSTQSSGGCCNIQ